MIKQPAVCVSAAATSFAQYLNHVGVAAAAPLGTEHNPHNLPANRLLNSLLQTGYTLIARSMHYAQITDTDFIWLFLLVEKKPDQQKSGSDSPSYWYRVTDIHEFPAILPLHELCPNGQEYKTRDVSAVMCKIGAACKRHHVRGTPVLKIFNQRMRYHDQKIKGRS